MRERVSSKAAVRLADEDPASASVPVSSRPTCATSSGSTPASTALRARSNPLLICLRASSWSVSARKTAQAARTTESSPEWVSRAAAADEVIAHLSCRHSRLASWPTMAAAAAARAAACTSASVARSTRQAWMARRPRTPTRSRFSTSAMAEASVRSTSGSAPWWRHARQAEGRRSMPSRAPRSARAWRPGSPASVQAPRMAARAASRSRVSWLVAMVLKLSFIVDCAAPLPKESSRTVSSPSRVAASRSAHPRTTG
mmetsp:Transcript_21577/g.58027  ORF Transcript_21577/g.58027 Transcript_21577/m.58027 type:complete len:257 (+) Transcript_21577:963-1733(+)